MPERDIDTQSDNFRHTPVPLAAGARNALGRYGEDAAVRYLIAEEMQILDRNWRCTERSNPGEIDVVARDGDALVICEVKTRRGQRFGSPLEAVTPLKVARLRRLAAAWIAVHDMHPAVIRLDVVGVTRPMSGPAVIDHVRGVGQ